MSEDVIDLDQLRGYTGGDPDIESEVFSLFREQCDVWGRALDPRGDENTWIAATHALKGLSRAMGAFKLGDACEAAEALAGEAGTPVARSVALETLRATMDEALGVFAKLEQQRAVKFRGAASGE